MNVFEVAIGKFVSPFGVLRIALVNSEVPFCVFAESVQTDKLILFVCCRPMLAPRAFAICDEVSLFNELHGKSKGLFVELKLRARLSQRRADREEQTCYCERTAAETLWDDRFHGIARKGLPPTQKWQTVFAPTGRSTAW